MRVGTAAMVVDFGNGNYGILEKGVGSSAFFKPRSVI